jgi:catechol 2,3-dioxygenase-like lactoylglutathione lyase family enzyme
MSRRGGPELEFRLDHVVIAVHDLERAVEDYRALGFTVRIGGRHPGRTSHNALIVFADGAYLELIAWPEPGPAERWYNALQEHGEGFIDFALIPADVPLAIEEARGRGLELSGPIDGSRLRPDGREVRWRTARQATFDLPFLCGDVTDRELRVPAGEARRHANGAAGIKLLTVSVRDLQRSLTAYEALLGRHLPGPAVPVGETQLLLEQAPQRREGPCAMRIGSTHRNTRLDSAFTHGAAIQLSVD